MRSIRRVTDDNSYVDEVNDVVEFTSKEKKFLGFLKEQNAYKEALTTLQWDSHTQIPRGGVDQRSEVVGILSGKLQQAETSDRMKDFIDEMKMTSENEFIRKVAEECERVYDKNRKIPNADYQGYVTLCSKAESVWEEAREKDDFSLFEPYLTEIVGYNQEFAELWGYEGDRYNALLDNNETGVTVEMLDKVFPELRKSLTRLIEQVQASPVKADVSLLKTPFPVESQKALSEAMLKMIGYRFEDGRLDTSVHPYSFAINPNDVRLSTKYDGNDFRTSVFSAVHEGGHALYEQNIGRNLMGTPLSAASSMGMHESQSLYWEMFVTADKRFWETNYDWFRSFAPDHFKSVSLDDFYLALHDVKASLIRIEADPLTYSMHIMLRYELEKALLNGDVKASELPHIWNELMQKYLGVVPENNRDGVLQDIHWSSGDFGYFPSYTLGYLYAAQLHNTMKKEISFESCLQTNDFLSIRQWFTEHVHRHGKNKQPLELLKQVTSEELNPTYLVQYLTEKYGAIYQF